MPAKRSLAAPASAVNGTILPKLNFEMRLPQAWDSKLYCGGGGGGGGGYNGAIPGLNLNALTQGYAQVSSDSGHQGSGLSASFALNDPQAAQAPSKARRQASSRSKRFGRVAASVFRRTSLTLLRCSRVRYQLIRSPLYFVHVAVQQNAPAKSRSIIHQETRHDHR